MPEYVKVSLPALIISISIIILLLLFWMFYKNATHISSTLDRKLSLEHSVSALSTLIGNVAQECKAQTQVQVGGVGGGGNAASRGLPDTTSGGVITPETCPHLDALLNSVERLRLMDDPQTYVFIIDQKGNQVVNGGTSSMAKTNGVRPGMNTLGYVDGSGKQVVKLILDSASSGGGYVEYTWPDPITRKQSKKLTYVKAIPNTPWVLGSGLYL